MVPRRRQTDNQRVGLEVKEGDTVYYSKWAGTEVTVEGETYLVMKEDDILAIAE